MTTYDAVAAFCHTLDGTQGRRPFGPQPLVMSTKEAKCYCFLYEDVMPPRITLKCDPMEAELLRAAYPAVTPGYHMNKRHWITVVLDGSVHGDELRRMIRNAYLLVSRRKGEVVPVWGPGKQ